MASGVISREGYYKPGDTFSTAANMALFVPGIITSSSGLYIGCFTVDKSLAAISSISITSLTGALRGTNGYVDSTADSTNLITKYSNIKMYKISDYNVKVDINKGSAFSNVTNNTPVILCCKMTIAFS